MKQILLFLCVVLSTACVSNRIVFEPNSKYNSSADYEDYLDQRWLGLVANQDIDLQPICMDEKIAKAEITRTPLDGLITAITLTTYSPITLRVWCAH